MGTTRTPRFRVSKRDIHLTVGWRWLIWDDVGCDYVEDEDGELLSFTSPDLAAQAIEVVNKEVRGADEPQ
jgi:hypothetical protein